MARIGRLAFLGTGTFAVPLLRRLPELADELLVVSTPDRPAGRGLKPRPSPVAEAARARELNLATPDRLRSDEGRALIRDFAPDGLLLAAYGQLVPREILEMASRAPLNVHPSLLPRHRGAAPVAATILAGDPVGGVTLMVMTPELDAGPIVAQWPVAVDDRETTPELQRRLAQLAADQVPGELARWANGDLAAIPQDDQAATVAPSFRREDGRIDWMRPAQLIDRQVRGLQPWPGAWTTLDGRRLHVRRARPVAGVSGVPVGSVLPGEPPRVAAGSGALELEVVQPEGRPAMPAADWRRGQREHLLLGAGGPGN
ncbi:MAG: methionyl-tRNA formyltransferase [Chloroflexi bacterium]|nr:MAG: methionyl-tRNA formyltransferase [Chloroflexota bacterium]